MSYFRKDTCMSKTTTEQSPLQSLENVAVAHNGALLGDPNTRERQVETQN